MASDAYEKTEMQEYLVRETKMTKDDTSYAGIPPVNHFIHFMT